MYLSGYTFLYSKRFVGIGNLYLGALQAFPLYQWLDNLRSRSQPLPFK